MLIHAAVHWLEIAYPSLWHLATELWSMHIPSCTHCWAWHGTYWLFYNFFVPHQQINDLHLWDCPNDVLKPTLQDRNKVPKWKWHSQQGVFLSLALWYASSIPLVLNPNNNHISLQFHVIFDDLFNTAVSELQEKEVPKEWDVLWITSHHKSTFDDKDPVRVAEEWLFPGELDPCNHHSAQASEVPSKL